MPNYGKGKIYTIRFTNDDEVYVGSTIQPLSVRFGGHKRDKDKSVYKYINDKYDGDFKHCYIELYESCPCESKEQLLKREGEVIRLIGTLNKVIAGRTDKERYEDNKEKILEYEKKRYKDNKEKISEKHKKYYEDNKDILAEKRKIKNEKITCECGCEVRKSNISRHMKTKNHIDFIANYDNKSSITHDILATLVETKVI
jgi:hypothetical protein